MVANELFEIVSTNFSAIEKKIPKETFISSVKSCTASYLAVSVSIDCEIRHQTA